MGTALVRFIIAFGDKIYSRIFIILIGQ